MDHELQRRAPVEALAAPVSDAPPVSEKTKRRQLIHIIVLDVLILIELAVAIYVAEAWREEYDFTLLFCATFFGLVIPTFFVSRIVAGRVDRVG